MLGHTPAVRRLKLVANLQELGSRAGAGSRRPALQRSDRSVGGDIYSDSMDLREAAQRWADQWERGWRDQDATTIAALYAEGAFWQQHPFREPEPDYLSRVFGEEESAQCWFGTPIVDGDQAAVRWTAQTRLRNGDTENLAGVSLLRFNAEGLVVEERDFWAEGCTQ